MEIRGIKIGSLVEETEKKYIYLGIFPDKNPVIIKSAKSSDNNKTLLNEVKWFEKLRTFNEEVEKHSKKIGVEYHFDWLFAWLVTTFVEPNQDDRRFSVFSMPETEIGKLIPLSKVARTTQIDSRTSVWILERIFKFYAYFELMRESGDIPLTEYPVFSSRDYLLGPVQHRLIYYNYSGSGMDFTAYELVKTITTFIKGWVVLSEEAEDKKYGYMLDDFSQKGRKSFVEAHGELQKTAKDLWGTKYHPFTFRNLN